MDRRRRGPAQQACCRWRRSWPRRCSGYWADRVGKRALFMLAGTLAMLPLFLAATYLPPGLWVALPFTGVAVPLTLLLVMLVLGVVFSLIPAVMWPAVAYLVDERRLGSAYSLMTFCQQIGWALVPLAIGALNDHFAAGPQNTARLRARHVVPTGLSAVGLSVAWRLWRFEARAG